MIKVVFYIEFDITKELDMGWFEFYNQEDVFSLIEIESETPVVPNTGDLVSVYYKKNRESRTHLSFRVKETQWSTL
jgi:hypothetical protein